MATAATVATAVAKFRRATSTMAAADSGNIKVCIRVRPFISQELSGERRQKDDPELRCCIDVSTLGSLDIFKNNDPSSKRTYDFDRVYWSHNKEHKFYATQETLHEELGRTMLANAVEGFNNCIFAYGQTGSGKSYSVLGGEGPERGLLPRVVEGLFDYIEKLPEGTTCKTSVSFLEIYNEQIRDLLTAETESPRGRKLDVKQHPILGIIIPGLTEAPVENLKAVMDLVSYGSKMRLTRATAMNACSSRSHCVFTFRTWVKQEISGETVVSQTNLVDLAGSERAKRTKAEGERLKEGANINQSLSVLARVISSLAKRQAKETPPFRDSKLTFILKESLSGNSKTAMVAAISPSNWDYEETLSTLKFAQSVKLVQTGAKKNMVNEENIERQLRAEADKLKKQLQELEEDMAAGSMSARNQQVVEAQRRLEEQEALLRRHAPGGWEMLLEREKKLRMRRRATMQGPVLTSLKGEIADFYKRNPHISFKPRSDQGSSSGNSLFDSPTNSASEEDDKPETGGGGPDEIELIHFGEDVFRVSMPDGTTFEASPPSARKSVLSVKGNSVKTFLSASNSDSHETSSSELTARLNALQPQLAEAQSLADRLARPGTPQVRLSAAVAVDLQSMQASLAVRAGTAESISDRLRALRPDEARAENEWVSTSQLSERVDWMRARSGPPCSSGSSWSDAREASAPSRWQAAAGGGEAADLQRQLAEAEEELRRAKAEMEGEERALASSRSSRGVPTNGKERQRVLKDMEQSLADATSAMDTIKAVLEGSGARSRLARAS